jgi:hypothetical protein
MDGKKSLIQNQTILIGSKTHSNQRKAVHCVRKHAKSLKRNEKKGINTKNRVVGAQNSLRKHLISNLRSK